MLQPSPAAKAARVSLSYFFQYIMGAALIHSPLGARGAEAAPRMHNSIWRQEKVTPAAQATETAHTYVMSHFVMPRHAPSASTFGLRLTRRETRDKAGMPMCLF